MDQKYVKLRNKLKAKKPAFKRQEWFRTVSLKQVWRSPRGIDSKLKRGEKARGAAPNIGYRSPKEARGLNQSGFREVRVLNTLDLKKVNPKQDIAVIGRTVGKKKRVDIIKKAEEAGVKIANF